jgi:hypothetical protein
MLAITALIIATLAFTIPTNRSEVASSQEKVEAFTEKVLPVDASKYNITLEGYFVSRPPDVNDSDRVLNNNKEERYRYLCVSDQSEFSVIYSVVNGILTNCIITVMKGPVLTDRPYSSLNEAATGFLEKYQAFSGLDTSEMRDMLSNIDTAKNQ